MGARLRCFILISCLIMAGAGLLLSACRTSNPPAEKTTAPDTAQVQTTIPTSSERGQELYRTNCAVCHGEKGERGATPLKDAAQQLEDAAIAVFIRNGIPSKGMPALTALTSEQIADVLAFVRSWSEP
jgi:mono/diheme cytochrome c family protein